MTYRPSRFLLSISAFLLVCSLSGPGFTSENLNEEIIEDGSRLTVNNFFGDESFVDENDGGFFSGFGFFSFAVLYYVFADNILGDSSDGH